MYKYSDNQINFSDFVQPIGRKMNAENRWVKKAENIPWTEIEQRYAALFDNKNGNVAKPLRLTLGACIIQAEYGYLDEDTGRAVPAIVSNSRPYPRPIVRGKAKCPVAFGTKLDISVVDGFTRLETFSFEAYNEATFLMDVIERFRQRTGKYPQRVLADKIY